MLPSAPTSSWRLPSKPSVHNLALFQVEITRLLAEGLSNQVFAALNSSRSNVLHLVAGKGASWLVPGLCQGRPLMLLERMANQRNERVRQRYLAALCWFGDLGWAPPICLCACVHCEGARLPRR